MCHFSINSTRILWCTVLCPSRLPQSNRYTHFTQPTRSVILTCASVDATSNKALTVGPPLSTRPFAMQAHCALTLDDVTRRLAVAVRCQHQALKLKQHSDHKTNSVLYMHTQNSITVLLARGTVDATSRGNINSHPSHRENHITPPPTNFKQKILQPVPPQHTSSHKSSSASM